MRIGLFFLAFFMAAISVTAQDSTRVPFKKASDGSEYLIYPSASGIKFIGGNIMEMAVLATYKDSVVFSTEEEGMPQYGLYDTANFPAPFKDMLKDIKVGDSLVMKIATDSIIAKGQAAPFMKPGGYIYQSYTFLNLYITKEQVDSAQKIHFPLAKERAQKKEKAMIELSLQQNKPQIDADSKLIEDYLAKNNIKAVKGKWGTYIVTKKAGTGKKITGEDIVAVNYTGKNFGTNKVFDSNTDPKFKHVEPYDVNMGRMSGLILGWFDALFEMQKGTVATIYIPSTLGYGIDGREPEIAPNTILVFDMAVVKVRTEAEMAAEETVKPAKTVAPAKPFKKPAVPAKKPVAKPKPKTKAAGK
jgi:FKBP-type peptidyl-prolyl cis-trans isomerase FkpA